ncbi:hypothetical protein EFR40_02545, partial [Limosilactobacillus fermentum]|nr:hypothetical protein [Limosilactobacillus fermentum]
AAKERLAAFSAKWESSYKRRIKNLVQMERTIPLRVDTLNNKSVISRGCFEWEHIQRRKN